MIIYSDFDVYSTKHSDVSLTDFLFRSSHRELAVILSLRTSNTVCRTKKSSALGGSARANFSCTITQQRIPVVLPQKRQRRLLSVFGFLFSVPHNILYATVLTHIVDWINHIHTVESMVRLTSSTLPPSFVTFVRTG